MYIMVSKSRMLVARSCFLLELIPGFQTRHYLQAMHRWRLMRNNFVKYILTFPYNQLPVSSYDVILFVFAQIDKSGIACILRIQLLEFTNILFKMYLTLASHINLSSQLLLLIHYQMQRQKKHANAIQNTPLIQTRLPKKVTCYSKIKPLARLVHLIGNWKENSLSDQCRAAEWVLCGPYHAQQWNNNLVQTG
jgi:hypothetical protein